MIENSKQISRLDSLLRTCIQCGLCLPHCATYLVTDNEAQSPRGRLLLLGEVLNGRATLDNVDIANALGTCLGCHACTAVCPSGISNELLAHARDLAADHLPSSNAVLIGFLESRSKLGVLGHLVDNVRSALTVFAGPDWRRRLDDCNTPLHQIGRMLGSCPTAIQTNAELIELLDGLTDLPSLPAVDAVQSSGPGNSDSSDCSANQCANGATVAFFKGCANAALLSGTSNRLIELLRAANCNVITPMAQECCGALATHTNRHGRAHELQQLNTSVFSEIGPFEYLVTEAAGCGLQLSEYPDEIAETVCDATVLLNDLTLPRFAEVPLQVVVLDPCHAQHGQGISAQPRHLLACIPGLSILEAEETTVCCGSGGTYSLRHPELSVAMGRRKARLLAVTGADLVVTNNPGCLGQVADGLALECPQLPIVPLTDLLWYAWQRAVLESENKSQ